MRSCVVGPLLVALRLVETWLFADWEANLLGLRAVLGEVGFRTALTRKLLDFGPHIPEQPVREPQMGLEVEILLHFLAFRTAFCLEDLVQRQWIFVGPGIVLLFDLLEK